jgi:anti-sigma factor RsiW
MTAEACRGRRELIGVYLLGALAPEERAALEAHLEGCEECRREAREIGPVAELLARADPAHLHAAPAPPAGLPGRIAAQIRRERRDARRRRTRVAAALAGAAAALAAIAVAAVALLSSGSAEPAAERVAFTGVPADIHLSAELEPRAWGSQVYVHVEGIHPGTLCTVWLHRASGGRVPAGSFRYRVDGSRADEEPVLSAALPLSQADAVGIRAGSRTFTAAID